MVGFVEGPVRVSVPATSANLGPGFDSLGLALGLRDELVAEVVPSGLHVEVDGEGSHGVPRDERHLVVRAMRAAFARMGAQPPGLRLSCRNLVPHARGLGSSSAAIVGGVCLARALVAGGPLVLDDDAVLTLAADLEGHPDNVAPALLGGFVIAGREHDSWFAVQAPVDPRVAVVVFVPPGGVRTETARGLLPPQVPHAEAAANAGRAALLVAALAGQPEQLLPATRDYLHQEQRRSAMPESLGLVDRLRGDGVPAVVSGAGPTVLAFTGGSVSARPDGLLQSCPPGWRAWQLAVDLQGARVHDG